MFCSFERPLTLLSMAFCLVILPAGAAFSQTEYDTNLQQAEDQENAYKAQLQAEASRDEPYREAYTRQLEKLESLGASTSTAHGRGTANSKQISSLTYWLKQEDAKRAQEDAALKNLDGWRLYWQSKKDSVLRTQAWNQEQIELDARAEQQRAYEAQQQAQRDAAFAQAAAEENAGYGNGVYGGYGGYGGRGYGGHSGHSYHSPTIHFHTSSTHSSSSHSSSSHGHH